MSATTVADEVLARLEALTARLDEQAATIAGQGAAIMHLKIPRPATTAVTVPAKEPTTNRRGMLRRLVGATVAATVLAVAKEAATANAATRTTILAGGGATDRYGLVAISGTVDPSIYLPPLGTTIHGVIGIADQSFITPPGKSGVLGLGNGSNGVVGMDTIGIGVWGLVTMGVGVAGASTDGVGLRGQGGRAPLSLVPSGAAGPPTTNVHVKGDVWVDSTGTHFHCTADGTPGTWEKGAAVRSGFAGGAAHYLSTPIRLLDTRPGATAAVTPGAPITGGTEFTLQVTGTSVGGISVPTGAVGVIGNATVVSPAGIGFLTIFAADVARPLASSSNFVAGQIVNTPVTAKLSATGAIKIYAAQTTHVVFDAVAFIS